MMPPKRRQTSMVVSPVTTANVEGTGRMPDHESGNRGANRGALFGGVFARGGTDTSDAAWLQAMLDAEAGLARALELAGLTGNPVPGLARALTRRVDGSAAGAVHRGATSQDILDTAAMLLARRAIDAAKNDLDRAADAVAA